MNEQDYESGSIQVSALDEEDSHWHAFEWETAKPRVEEYYYQMLSDPQWLK